MMMMMEIVAVVLAFAPVVLTFFVLKLHPNQSHDVSVFALVV